jgi:hypothetical protein
MTTPLAAPDRTLLEALRRRLQQRGRETMLKETHISWVLLAGRLALKLKKPVRLPFLDFGTPASRRHFCEEELRLNQRLAPSLYRAVVAVRGSADAPRFKGPGEAIDHVLCMRRFPEGSLLSERLAQGLLQAGDLDRLALHVADFHAASPVAPADAPYGRARQIVQPVQNVLGQLAIGAGTEATAPLRLWVEAQCPRLDAAWDERRTGGFVRECHGDLHLANTLRLGNEVTAFDCIEFDPALRWIDVMNDVAFLLMDLKAHGRDDLAWGFLDTYLQCSGDYAGLKVLRFYEVYRAAVRALVTQIGRCSGGAEMDGPDYLRCARRLAAGAGEGPRLAILFGPSGVGKSTLAQRLLQQAGAVRIRSDVERKRLGGLRALQPSRNSVPDLYAAGSTRATYERLATCARAALEAGYAVIVDAAFLRRAERRAFEALAQELGVPFTILACRADEAVLRRRVAQRAAAGCDPSEADLAVLEHQLRDHDTLETSEQRHAIVLDTGLPVDIAELTRCWRKVATDQAQASSASLE